MGNKPGCSALAKVVSPALVTSSHPVLLPMDAHMMTLKQQDFIPVSQVGLLMLKEVKFDFKAVVPHCCLDVSKLHLAYQLSVVLQGKLTLQWLTLARSLTLCATSYLFCNDRGDNTSFNRPLEGSASSVKYTRGSTQSSQKSPDNFPSKPHVSAENIFISF